LIGNLLGKRNLLGFVHLNPNMTAVDGRSHRLRAAPIHAIVVLLVEEPLQAITIQNGKNDIALDRATHPLRLVDANLQRSYDFQGESASMNDTIAITDIIHHWIDAFVGQAFLPDTPIIIESGRKA
jgi:hypothetical protein